jgi:hypothetical protein
MNAIRTSMASIAVSLAMGMVVMGCGAAYYGAVFGFIATSKKSTTIDESFPDAVPTDPQAPASVTLKLSAQQVTLNRTTAAGVATESTGFEIESFEFPPGFGETTSNRDTDTTLVDGDKLVVRINGDDAKEITFGTTDVASIGTAVAAGLQAKVRLLTPTQTTVPVEAYTLFTARWDASTRSFSFRSGVPSAVSEVAWSTEPRPGTSDATPDDVAKATATRLGLGVANGGIEVTGDEVVRITVINRGTDVISGSSVDVYLSQDKVLAADTDLKVGSIDLSVPIKVGEARRYSLKSSVVPPTRLLASDLKPGHYYLLFDVQSGGDEKSLDNNLAISLRPLQIVQPVDDPATTAVETADPLDFALTATASPISVVTGADFTGTVSLTNYGAVVPASGIKVDLDLVLSSDKVFDPRAALSAANTAGIVLNPRDPNRAITLRLVSTGTGGTIKASPFGNTVTLTYDASTVAPVQSLIDTLNNDSGNLLSAIHDGVGTATLSSASVLLAAQPAGTELIAKDVFLASRQVTFLKTTQQQQIQTFTVSGTLDSNAFDTALLPVKLIPLFRIRPTLVNTTLTENPRNNVREARNFVRIYDRGKAAFDTTTGVILPTQEAADFAILEAVAQRPVNSGSIRQGQQRVFRFEIPAVTGLTTDESQVLIVLRAAGFDAHLDLLNSNGSFITGVDDSSLQLDPIIYRPFFANTGNRTFYLVVSPARFDESDLTGGEETFELAISVNARQAQDAALVKAVSGENVLTPLQQRFAIAAANAAVEDTAQTENNVLIPFSLANSKAEVMFVLPRRARVRFRSQPVATVSLTTQITRFVSGQVPSPVEFQAELDAAATGIVYRPSGGNINTSHELEAGVYTVAFSANSNATDTQPFRFEVTTEFIPPVVVAGQ